MRDLWLVDRVSADGSVEHLHGLTNEASARAYYAEARPKPGTVLVLRKLLAPVWVDVEKKGAAVHVLASPPTVGAGA